VTMKAWKLVDILRSRWEESACSNRAFLGTLRLPFILESL
jgi:hypothetical protein